MYISVETIIVLMPLSLLAVGVGAYLGTKAGQKENEK